MQKDISVVIMAGGLGTRLLSGDNIPKPMVNVDGKPVLYHQIECLKKQGFMDITLIIGYLSNVIKDYFKDSVKYIEEKFPMGTAGGLSLLKNKNKDILLINGDLIFDVDFFRFVKFHYEKGGVATLFTHPNNHPYDSGIIIKDSDERVIDWIHKEDFSTYYKNCVNAGLHILSSTVVENIKEEKTDLDRDVLKKLIKTSLVYAYSSPEYIKDLGTPIRYEEVCSDVCKGIVKGKNLKNKQKAYFFDRDGTINKYKGFIKEDKDIELISKTVNMIKIANKEGYLAIVVTNQPVIARGDISIEQLNYIHNKLEWMLGEQGAYVDDILYCPHHQDGGFQGEVKELKIKCNCRKPLPGMLFEAAEKYNIDLANSYMVGDSQSDILAGKAAGCNCILVERE